MLCVVEFASVRKVFARSSSPRMFSSLPPSALFSSSVMIRSWSSPPPLISSDASERASSTVGAVSVSGRPSVAPSSSAAPSLGLVTSMKSSPSGVV
jgi:hypothetical protein